MQPQRSVHNELQTLLGETATEQATWNELRRFEQAALPLIEQFWQLNNLENPNDWMPLLRMVQSPHDNEMIINAAKQLVDALGDNAGACAASFYLNPQLWQPGLHRERGRSHEYHYFGHLRVQLLNKVACACVSIGTPADWPARLARRIRTLCLATGVVHAPDLGAMVQQLLLHDSGQITTVIDALTRGEYERAWQTLGVLAGANAETGAEGLAVLWPQHGDECAVALLARLYQRGDLDLPAFRRLLFVLPSSLRSINAACYWDGTTDTYGPEFRATLVRLLDAVLWDMLCDLRPETWPTLSQMTAISGGRALLRIIEEVEQRDLKTLRPQHYRPSELSGLLGHLLSLLRRRNEDDSAELVHLLKQFRPATLLLVLPDCDAYTPELTAALEWRGAEALVNFIRKLETNEAAHSTEPTAGLVPRRVLATIVEQLEETQLEALLAAFAASCPAAVLLLRAALGVNRTEVRRQFGRRRQLAARAMGLLPLVQPDEVVQRYLALRRYEREANSSGAGRKAYERAAAQAGLANLAELAGYSDVTRLEWAMEDKIGAEQAAIGREWMIEGYSLKLVLLPAGPALEIRNPKRMLKRVPAAVSRDYAYREVKSTLEQAQDQQRRYRQSLLMAMRNVQRLTRDELLLLRRNPLAVDLLERLVLIDESGAVGLFRAEDMALEGVHGERVLIGNSVCVAHPLQLDDLGLLHDWQLAVVKQEIVQPFKQVFRELYRLTPAEEAAGYSSARLAGRRTRGRQALAVLANLGWTIEGSTVRKPFYEHGFEAHFYTGADFFYGYDDGDNDQSTSGELEFWPFERRKVRGEEWRVPLTDIPAMVFSEVLRDIDLVTTIAHDADGQSVSQEVVRQRGELVRTLSAALGLGARVLIAEPHVYVQGELTRYRVHLATAAIYLENGQYLCIVPSPKQRSAIYLPYAEDGDAIGSELVSKVLQLVNDTAINDPSILAQIRPSQRAA